MRGNRIQHSLVGDYTAGQTLDRSGSHDPVLHLHLIGIDGDVQPGHRADDQAKAVIL